MIARRWNQLPRLGLGLPLVRRKCCTKMANSAHADAKVTSLLDPPIHVRGMKVLDRRLFDKQVRVPCLRVTLESAGRVLQSVKKFMLRMENLKPVDSDDLGSSSTKVILLNPDLVSCVDDLGDGVRQALCKELEFRDVQLSYVNFKSEQVLNAVLPEDAERTTAYSRVGHIVHVNLRDHLFDYRHLIGQVLLDKLRGVKCVVNKTDAIETEFRNFKMEILARSDDSHKDDDDDVMIANVHENGCKYEFDFGRVFWNPRLSSEHERLAALLPDIGHVVLYDVFAGVGPFAVPAARRRKCRVLANDLNPDSFRWLQHNVKLNKIVDRVTCYNLDGRDFIRDVISKDMMVDYGEDESVPEAHVVMNLPALAVDFLDAFRGLLRGRIRKPDASTPMIHCYAFIKCCETEVERDGLIVDRLEAALGHALDRSETRITFVRKVAPNKDMIRATFRLPVSVLYDEDHDLEPDSKRPRLELNIQQH